MKRSLLVLGLVVAAVGMSGCIVIHTEEEGPCKPVQVQPEDATLREIDAVGKLAFDHDRKEGYERIARREGLRDGAQVYLVEAVFKRLAFEEMKVDVLLTLVKNPSFSAAAEAALLDRVERLSFEHDKRKVLDAINERKA